MLQQYLFSYLKHYLGAYVKNLNEESLNVSVWRGDVELKNLEIKESILEQLELPLHVSRGLISSLIIKVPWTQLSSKSIELEIDELYLAVSLKSEAHYDKEKEDRDRFARRQKELKAIEDAAKQRENGTSETTSKPTSVRDSFWMRLLIRLIDNVQIQIKRVHIRVEDGISKSSDVSSFGLVMEKLYVMTVDETGKYTKRVTERQPAAELIRKQCDLTNLAVYWNALDEAIKEEEGFATRMGAPFDLPRNGFKYILNPVSGNVKITINESDTSLRTDRAKSEFNSRVMDRLGITWKLRCIEAIGQEEWEEFVQRMPPRVGNMKWTLTYLFTEAWSMAQYHREREGPGPPSLQGFKDALNACLQWGSVPSKGLEEVISEFHAAAIWVRDDPTPMVSVRCSFEDFGVELRREQYLSLLSLVSTIHLLSARARYKHMRPSSTPKKDPAAWWHFAIRAITTDLRDQKRGIDWANLLIHQKKRRQYVELYKRKQVQLKKVAIFTGEIVGTNLPRAFSSIHQDPQLSKELTPDDIGLLASLDTVFEVSDVVYLRSLAAVEAEKEKKQEEEEKKKLAEEEQKSGSSWYSWFYGTKKASSSTTPETALGELTVEDQKQLYEVINFDPEATRATPENPRDIILDLTAVLGTASVTLSADKKRNKHGTTAGHGGSEDVLLHASLISTEITTVLRAGGVEGYVKLSDLSLTDHGTRATEYKRIISRLSLKDTAILHPSQELASLRLSRCEDPLPFVMMRVEAPPLDGSASLRFHLYVQPLDIVVSVPATTRAIAFFSPPSSINLEAAKSAALTQIRNLRSLSSSQLSEAIKRHKRVSLDVRIAGPRIKVPEDVRSLKAQSALLVINAGRLNVVSCPSKRQDEASKSVCSMPMAALTNTEDAQKPEGKSTATEAQRAPASPGSDKRQSEAKEMATYSGQAEVDSDLLYDCISITTSGFGIFVGGTEEFIPGEPFLSHLSLISDVGLRFSFFTSIVRNDVNIPISRLVGVVSPLSLTLSSVRYAQLVRLAAALGKSHKEELLRAERKEADGGQDFLQEPIGRTILSSTAQKKVEFAPLQRSHTGSSPHSGDSERGTFSETRRRAVKLPRLRSLRKKKRNALDVSLTEEEETIVRKRVVMQTSISLSLLCISLGTQKAGEDISPETSLVSIVVKDASLFAEQKMYRSDSRITLSSLVIEDKHRERLFTQRRTGDNGDLHCLPARTEDLPERERLLAIGGQALYASENSTMTATSSTRDALGRELMAVSVTSISAEAPSAVLEVEESELTGKSQDETQWTRDAMTAGCVAIDMSLGSMNLYLNRDTISALLLSFGTATGEGPSKKEPTLKERGKQSSVETLPQGSVRGGGRYRVRELVSSVRSDVVTMITPHSRRSGSASSFSGSFMGDPEYSGGRKGKSFSEHYEDVLVLMVRMKLQRLAVTLNSELQGPVAKLSTSGLEVELRQTPRSLKTDFSISNVMVQDLTPLGKLHRDILTFEKEGGERSAQVKQRQIFSGSLISWIPFDNQSWHPGYKFGISLSLSRPRLIFLNRFLDEVRLWATSGPIMQALALMSASNDGSEIKMKSDEQDEGRLTSQGIMYDDVPVALLPKIEIEVTGAAIEMPRNSYSKESLRLLLGGLKIDNSSTLPLDKEERKEQVLSPADSEALDDEFYDTLEEPADILAARSLCKLEVCVSDLRIVSYLSVGRSPDWTSPRRSLQDHVSQGLRMEEQSLMGSATISATINVDRHLSVAVHTSRLPFVLSQLQHATLLGDQAIPRSNFQERALICVQERRTETYGSSERLERDEGRGGGVLASSMSVRVNIPVIILEIVSWDHGFTPTESGDLFIGSEDQKSAFSLARLRLSDFEIVYDISLIGTSSIELRLQGLVIQDTRASTSSFFPEFQQFLSLEKAKEQAANRRRPPLSLVVTSRMVQEFEHGRKLATTDVSLSIAGLRLIASDLLFVMMDFYYNPMPPAGSNLADEDIGNDGGSSPTSSEEGTNGVAHDQGPPYLMSVSLELQHPSICLVKDVTDGDSPAMMLTWELQGKYLASSDNPKASLSLSMDHIRGTAASKDLLPTSLPAPTSSDAISPFALRMMLERDIMDGSMGLSLASDEEVSVRVGYVDGTTIRAGLNHLLSVRQPGALYLHQEEEIFSPVEKERATTRRPLVYGSSVLRLFSRTTYEPLWTGDHNFGYGPVLELGSFGGKSILVLPPINPSGERCREVQLRVWPSPSSNRKVGETVRYGDVVRLSNVEGEWLTEDEKVYGALSFGGDRVWETRLWKESKYRLQGLRGGVVQIGDTIFLDGISNYQREKETGGMLMTNGYGNAPVSFLTEGVQAAPLTEQTPVASSSSPSSLSPRRQRPVSAKLNRTVWLDVKQCRILIVNDANNMQVPLFYLCLEGLRVIQSFSFDGRQSLLASMSAEVQYYNKVRALWEPLVETFSFSYSSHYRGGTLSDLQYQEARNLTLSSPSSLSPSMNWGLSGWFQASERAQHFSKMLLQDLLPSDDDGKERERDQEEAVLPEYATLLSFGSSVEVNVTQPFLNMILDTYRDFGAESVVNSLGTELCIDNQLGVELFYTFETIHELKAPSFSRVGKKSLLPSPRPNPESWRSVKAGTLVPTGVSAHTFPSGRWAPSSRRKVWIKIGKLETEDVGSGEPLGESEFEPVQVTVDHEGSRGFSLGRADRPILSEDDPKHLYILCDLVAEGGTRVLRVRSPLRIKNLLGVPLRLYFLSSEESHIIDVPMDSTAKGIEETKKEEETLTPSIVLEAGDATTVTLSELLRGWIRLCPVLIDGELALSQAFPLRSFDSRRGKGRKGRERTYGRLGQRIESHQNGEEDEEDTKEENAYRYHDLVSCEWKVAPTEVQASYTATAPFCCSVMWTKDHWTPEDEVISLLPPLTLENCLPTVLDYQLALLDIATRALLYSEDSTLPDTTTALLTGSLHPGQKLPVFCLDPPALKTSIALSLALPAVGVPFDGKLGHQIVYGSGTNCSEIALKADSGASLLLKLDRTAALFAGGQKMQTAGSLEAVTCSFYVPFWLIDATPWDLIFDDGSTSGFLRCERGVIMYSAPSASQSTRSLLPSPLDSIGSSKAKLEMKVAVRQSEANPFPATNRSEWSNTFDLSTVGTSGILDLLPEPANRSRIRKELAAFFHQEREGEPEELIWAAASLLISGQLPNASTYGLSVQNNTGPGRYFRTSVILVKPSVLIVNNLSRVIAVKQEFLPDSSAQVVNARTTVPLRWSLFSFPRRVQVSLGDGSIQADLEREAGEVYGSNLWTEWSASFDAQTLGKLILPCRTLNAVETPGLEGCLTSSGQTEYVEVNVEERETTVIITLTPGAPSDLYYQVNNDCCAFQLELREKGGRTAWRALPPLSSTALDWLHRVEAPILEVRISKPYFLSRSEKDQERTEKQVSLEVSLEHPKLYLQKEVTGNRRHVGNLSGQGAADSHGGRRDKQLPPVQLEIKMINRKMVLYATDEPSALGPENGRLARKILLRHYKTVRSRFESVERKIQQAKVRGVEDGVRQEEEIGPFALSVELKGGRGLEEWAALCRQAHKGNWSLSSISQSLAKPSIKASVTLGRDRVVFPVRLTVAGALESYDYPNSVLLTVDRGAPFVLATDLEFSLVQNQDLRLSSLLDLSSLPFGHAFDLWCPLLDDGNRPMGQVHLLLRKLQSVHQYEFQERRNALEGERAGLAALARKLEERLKSLGIILPPLIPTSERPGHVEGRTDPLQPMQRIQSYEHMQEEELEGGSAKAKALRGEKELQISAHIHELEAIDSLPIWCSKEGSRAKLYAAITYRGESVVTDAIQVKKTPPERHEGSVSSSLGLTVTVDPRRPLGIEFAKFYNMAIVKLVYAEEQCRDYAREILGSVLVAINGEDLTHLSYSIVSAKLRALVRVSRGHEQEEDGEKKEEEEATERISLAFESCRDALALRSGKNPRDRLQNLENEEFRVNWKQSLPFSHRDLEGGVGALGGETVSVAVYVQDPRHKAGISTSAVQGDSMLPLFYFSGDESTLSAMDTSRFGSKDYLLGSVSFDLSKSRVRGEAGVGWGARLRLAIFSSERDVDGLRRVGVLNMDIRWDEHPPIESVRIKSLLRIEMPRLGLSFVRGGSDPHELLYLSLTQRAKEQWGLFLSTALLSNNMTHYELEFGHVQLDNQLAGAAYGVALRPLYAANPDLPAFQGVAVVSSKEGATFLHFSYLFLQPLELRMDDLLLSEIILYLQSINYSASTANTGDLELGESNVLEIGGPNCDTDPDTTLWKSWVKGSYNAQTTGISPKAAPHLFIEWLHIFPIRVSVTFTTSSEQILGTIILPKNVGGVIRTAFNVAANLVSNIDQAPLEVLDLHLEDVFETYEAIQARILAHFKESLVRGVYGILGSFEFLGNPVGLVGTLKGGVKEFFLTPAHLLLQGEGENGLLQVQSIPRGFLEGSKRLFQTTAVGLLHTTGLISDTMGKGVAVLSMDKDYYNRRKKKTKVPRNLKEGLISAVGGFTYGIYDGARGCLCHPIQGGRSSGLQGCLAGVCTGTVGLVTKPVVGVLDLTTYTFQGLKASLDPRLDSNLEAQRMRLPRYIGDDRILFPYSQREAEGQKLMRMLADGRRSDAYTFHIALGGRMAAAILLLTDRHLLAVHGGTRKISWSIDVDRRLEPHANGDKVSVIQYSSDNPKGKSFHFSARAVEDARVMVFAIGLVVAGLDMLTVRWKVLEAEKTMVPALMGAGAASGEVALSLQDDVGPSGLSGEVVRQEILRCASLMAEVLSSAVRYPPLWPKKRLSPDDSVDGYQTKGFVDAVRPFRVYRIEVTGERYKWEIFRRFKDIQLLLEALRREGYDLSRIPPLSLAAAGSSVLDKEASISSLLNELVQHTEMRSSLSLRNFLYEGSTSVARVNDRLSLPL